MASTRKTSSVIGAPRQAIRRVIEPETISG
jgi:hypothetical protein